MNPDPLDLRLSRFRSRRDEYPHALATALIEAGRSREALEVVQLGLASHADDPALLVLEGRAWFEDGDLPQAQASLLRAAKLSPRDKEPYRWLAQVLLMRGEPVRASQVLERALLLDPEDRTLQQAKSRADRLASLARASSVPPPGKDDAAKTSARAPEPRAEKRSAVFGKVTPSERPPAVELKVEQFERDPDTFSPASAPRARSLPAPLAHNSNQSPGFSARTSQPALPPLPGPAAQASAPPKAPIIGPPLPERASKPSLPIPPRAPVAAADDDEEDAPTIAAEMPREVRSWLEAERDAQPREPAAVESVPAPTYAMPASESGVSLDVLSADLSEVAPQVEPPGAAESPEAVLAVLRDHGVFTGETPQAQTPTWVPEGEAGRPGQRVTRSILAAWLVAVLGAGGGYYGFNRWLDARRGDARALVTHAEGLARAGDYPSLLAAERDLVAARALDPKSRAALEELLFVHATRALEDASGELGYLHATLIRAREQGVAPSLLAAGEAVVAAYEGKPEAASTSAESAERSAREDARVAYLVGRLYARAGRPDASALLSQAVEHEPNLALGWLALGELAREHGDAASARAAFEKARGKGQSLRAELWLLLMDAEAGEAAALGPRFFALAKRIEAGSRSERLLAVVASAELALAARDPAAARAALRGAGDLSVRDPEVMYALATRALRADEAQVAYRAARAATTLAPSSPRYRDALIEALLLRGDGEAALEALAGEPIDGPALAFVRARAALLGDGAAALEDAKRALSVLKPSEPSQQAARAAYLARVDVRLGASPESLLPAARTLAQRSKDQLPPQLSLAELALAAHQPKDAELAAQRALALAPDDAEALTLLGRAQRMAGDVTTARATLERAAERAPARRDAARALGSLLLDSGDADVALAIFDRLARATGALRDRLSAVEAQLASGNAAVAEAQLQKLDDTERELPSARLLTARVALARGQAEQAVQALAPLLAADDDAHTAELLTLQGDALYALGRIDSSAGAYDDALELDPSYPEALLGRATAALRADKLGQTGDLLTRAEESLAGRVRAPSLRAGMLVVRARLAFAQKDFTRVREACDEALELRGCPAEAEFWMAEALSKQKSPAATDHYSRYLTLAPEGPYAARAKRALSPR